MNLSITDIHMHIVPEVDDGSTSMEMSLEMARLASAQGAKTIFATSHGDNILWEIGAGRNTYRENFNQLKERISEARIPVQLYTGAELFWYEDYAEENLAAFADGRLPSLNHTRYVLVEFDQYDGSFSDIMDCIRIMKKHGWNVIIAHVERYYRFLHSIDKLEDIKNAGALLQVNAYSLEKEPDTNIKLLARKVVEHHLLDFIGSDAHRTTHRPPDYSDGVNYLVNHLETDYVEQVLHGNAERLLMG